MHELSEAQRDWALLIARLLLVSVFLLGAINWIFLQGHGPVGLLEKSGWPMAGLLSWLALLAKATGALSVTLGYKTQYGALLLIAFTMVATGGFHLPASVMPPDTTVFKEVGLIGGFILLAVVGPGSLSLDAKRAS